MIDATKHMIVAKGKIETSRIDTCVMNPATNKYDIKFTNGRTYSYMMSNVLVLSNPSILNSENYVIRTADGKKLFGAKCIYQFSSGSDLYWHIEFNGFSQDYKKSELRVVENCLANKKSANLFDYLRDVSKLDAEEIRYAYNPGTHLDFLIYNKMSKQPVLAIEVDGFKYHKAGTIQHERDIKKNHILEMCGLKLVRLGTNESGEKEKIAGALNAL